MSEPVANVRASSVARARRLFQHKFRVADGAFLAEGPQACREAARYGRVLRLFATTEAIARYDDVIAEVERKGGEVVPASPEVIASLATAVAPQGMVAVVEYPSHDIAAVFTPRARLVVAMAQVRDPGNAGAVIRVADAVGADGVLASVDSVDMTNPKVVRATVGSLFHLPVVEEVDLASAIFTARSQGMQVLAADGSGETLGPGVDLGLPTMWVLGNEAWGLPDEVLALVDRAVALPIYGKAESLNVATAAAVLLYASARAQRGA